MKINYKTFIEQNFEIIDKQQKRVTFRLNEIQSQYLQIKTWTDAILKARQQGFSSLITAIFTTDFILEPNAYSVIVADNDENAEGLLEKTKIYIASYETKNSIKIPLTYNSKNELHNTLMNSKIIIGTARNTDFGRSKTITNLHFSEVAFFPDVNKILAAAGEAVVEGGKKILETTANGYNEFKSFWDAAKNGENGYKPLFFPASRFYSQEFLAKKKKDLKELFPQEYPETDTEAFLVSGDCFFDTAALAIYQGRVQMPLKTGDTLFLNNSAI